MRKRKNTITTIALLCVLVAPPLRGAQDPAREQSRSMVMTQYGVVATLQAVASQAGAAILARGGSAVDAAVAANAALGVIEPMMNGVGGDLFAVVYDNKAKHLYGLNSSGWAPKELTVEAFRERSRDGMRSCTVGASSRWPKIWRPPLLWLNRALL
jgi:gamma-glutamyltranspeptidase/glutathione hydrolase